VATSWEQKQKEIAEANKTKTITRGVSTSLLDIVRPDVAGGATAMVIDIVGTVGMVAYQYDKTKKEAQKKAAKDKKTEWAQGQVDRVLDILMQSGAAVVNKHGIDPTTAKFEEVLYKALFKIIGYRGSCNMIAWAEGSKIEKGKQRPYLFRVTNKGRKFIPVKGFMAPKNIQAYYYVQCKNMRDAWANTYQQLLIDQGRLTELEAFQATRRKGVKVLRIAFGLIFVLLMFFVIKYGVTIR